MKHLRKKLKHFHIPPTLSANFDTKTGNTGSYITGNSHLLCSKVPVICDDTLVRRSKRGVGTLGTGFASSTQCGDSAPLGRIRSSSIFSSLILQVSAERAYWYCIHSSSCGESSPESWVCSELIVAADGPPTY